MNKSRDCEQSEQCEDCDGDNSEGELGVVTQ